MRYRSPNKSETFYRATRFSWKGDYQAQFSWRPLDPNSEIQPVTQQNLVFSDIMILGPSMNNEFRAGYNRRALSQTSLTNGTDWGKQFGIPNIGSATFPNFNIGYGIAALNDYKNIGVDQTLLGTGTSKEVVCGNDSPGPPKERVQICLIVEGPTSPAGLRPVTGGWYLGAHVQEDNFEYRYTALFEEGKPGQPAGGPRRITGARIRGGYFFGHARRKR